MNEFKQAFSNKVKGPFTSYIKKLSHGAQEGVDKHDMRLVLKYACAPLPRATEKAKPQAKVALYVGIVYPNTREASLVIDRWG